MTKVCLITCYKQPDYIRAKTLRAAFKDIDTVDLVIVKNNNTGFLRYFEVIWKLIVVRVAQHPDLYFLTFRGYEMLPILRLITMGKPFIFDEFINLIEWVIYEHHKIKQDSLLAKILYGFYKFWLKSVDLIVTDTASHAKYSSELMNISIDKYMPLVVSADESTFRNVNKKSTSKNEPFKVFYYGSMLPLHGVDIVLKAMYLLKGKDIQLVLIGGKQQIVEDVQNAKVHGVNIDYKAWVPFDDLAKYMQEADVCLGGPFGGTVQSQFVVTGKTYQFMQAGKPVIIGENKESNVFIDKENALIVKQSNPEALAAAILWAKQNPVKLRKIGESGQKLYKNNFSNKRLTQQLLVLLTNKHILKM